METLLFVRLIQLLIVVGLAVAYFNPKITISNKARKNIGVVLIVFSMVTFVANMIELLR